MKNVVLSRLGKDPVYTERASSFSLINPAKLMLLSSLAQDLAACKRVGIPTHSKECSRQCHLPPVVISNNYDILINIFMVI